MMDVATLVLTAVIVSVIAIVLQIVLLVVVLDMKKKNSKISHKPYGHDFRDAHKPKDSDNRFANTKRPHDQRTKPIQTQQQPQSADPVERSLRDINLRLKNAERDQEKERKRIKDTITPESQKKFDDNRQTRDRDESFKRHDRQRNSQPRRNNDNQRQNNDNRNAQPQQQREPKVIASTAEVAAAPEIQERILPQTIAAPLQQPVAVPPPAVEVLQPVVEPVIEAVPATEIMQHGRKVIVKRRVLNLEDENNNSPEGTVPVQSQAKEALLEAPVPEAATDTTSSEPIHFGR